MRYGTFQATTVDIFPKLEEKNHEAANSIFSHVAFEC